MVYNIFINNLNQRDYIMKKGQTYITDKGNTMTVLFVNGSGERARVMIGDTECDVIVSKCANYELVEEATKAIKELNDNGTTKLSYTHRGVTVVIAEKSKKDWKYLSVWYNAKKDIFDICKTNLMELGRSVKSGTWTCIELVEFK